MYQKVTRVFGDREVDHLNTLINYTDVAHDAATIGRDNFDMVFRHIDKLFDNVIQIKVAIQSSTDTFVQAILLPPIAIGFGKLPESTFLLMVDLDKVVNSITCFCVNRGFCIVMLLNSN